VVQGSKSNEARSWRDWKAHSLMVPSNEELTRRTRSDESARPPISSVCPLKGASTVSSVDVSNSYIVASALVRLNAATMDLCFVVQS
jgi:hypothetical protein